MLNYRSIGLRTLSLLCLLVLVSVSFWSWLYIWEQDDLLRGEQFKPCLLYNEILLVGIFFGLGGRRRVEGPHHEFVAAVRQSVQQAVLGLFAVLVTVVALEDHTLSRWFFLSLIPWLYGALLCSNYIVPKFLAQLAFSGAREERVALAGTPEQARQFKPWLERKNSLGFRTVGLVSPQPVVALGTNGNGNAIPVLGCLDEVSEILQKTAITQLIVLDLGLGQDRLRRLAQLCESTTVRLLAIHDLNSYFNHTTTTFEDDGLRFVGLREEPLESPANRFIKRLIDLAIALPVALLVLPPVTLLVWLLHRLQSPGPVFFKQPRVGMLGRPFKMYKYRTMHLNHGNEARQATKDDDRIFPAGRWLRKLSIDELPQFLNVLRGEMSVVGPRPHLETHEDLWVKVMRGYVVRRFIAPGITGWAQVQGYRGEVHTEEDIRRRVQADIHYLENWSFSLDCMILIKTVVHCLFPPRTAY